MGVNANAINNFNKRQQQQAAQTANPNATPIVNSKMSVADIALMQKDVNTLTDEEKLRRKALETKVNLQDIEDQKQKQVEADEEEARKQHDIARVMQNEIARNLKVVGDSPAKAWFENAPTPGGIGILLLIIGFFLLAIVPVDNNGNTRLMLIWLTLTGKTHLSYSEGIQGASGDFGGTSNNTPLPNPPPVSTPTPTVSNNANFTMPSIPSLPSGIDLGLNGLFFL